jgi:hypothetical protein
VPRKLTIKDFITKAHSVHGERYDYSKVEYVNNTTKIEIICPKHGSFWQVASGHLQGYSCQKCGGKYIPTTKEWIARAHSVHGDKYNYSNVEYVGATKKVEIVCKIHGSFFQTPSEHVNGKYGCQKCGWEHSSKVRLTSTLDVVNKCKKIHGNVYDYSKINFNGYNNKIEIICRKHGSWFAKAGDIIFSRSGCPMCNASKGELLTENYLNDNGIIYIRQMTFDDCKGVTKRPTKLRFDFYLPHYNILIEIDGAQHFVNSIGSLMLGRYRITKEDFERTKQNDDIKNRYAFDNKIKMVRIPYRNKTDYNNIVPILTKEII